MASGVGEAAPSGGGFFGAALRAITHACGHADDLIKGATLAMSRDEDDPAPAGAGGDAVKYDILLCEHAWYKLQKDGRTPGAVRWRDTLDNVHSVEHTLDDTKSFEIFYYSSRDLSGKGDLPQPQRRQRSLLCDSEAERDDWVVLFRALCTNHFQRLFEAELIPAPGVYQWHLNVDCDAAQAAGGRAILLLSTQQLQLVAVPTSQQHQVLLQAPCGGVTKLERFLQAPAVVRVFIAQQPAPLTLRTKDPLEALAVAAEVARVARKEGGAAPPVTVSDGAP